MRLNQVFATLYFQASVQVVPLRVQDQLFHRHRRLRDYDGYVYGAVSLLRDETARLGRDSMILLMSA